MMLLYLSPGQGPTKFFAAYKQISLIGSVPTKFTINSTTNWGLCLQAVLACLPTLSGPDDGASRKVLQNDGKKRSWNSE